MRNLIIALVLLVAGTVSAQTYNAQNPYPFTTNDYEIVPLEQGVVTIDGVEYKEVNNFAADYFWPEIIQPENLSLGHDGAGGVWNEGWSDYIGDNDGTFRGSKVFLVGDWTTTYRFSIGHSGRRSFVWTSRHPNIFGGGQFRRGVRIERFGVHPIGNNSPAGRQ